MLLVHPTTALTLPQAFTEAPQTPENGLIRPLTEREGYLLALYWETLQNDLSYGDFALLARIAKAESHFRQFTENGDVLRGKKNPRDIGIFQINEKYHADDAKEAGYDIYDPEGNIKFAVHLYKREGAKPWLWSKGKWNK